MKSHQKKEKQQSQFANVTQNYSAQQVAINNQNENFSDEEMIPLRNNGSNQIYYVPKQKKAMYKKLGESATAPERTPSSPIASFASSLGSDLLRMSGRGDYIPASAYNDQKNKGPLALNVGNERFGFSTTLFKKRADKNPSPDKNKDYAMKNFFSLIFTSLCSCFSFCTTKK
jgi:hypothetical protein